MIDNRPVEPVSLIKARNNVSEAQRKVATAQSAVDGAVEASAGLGRTRPWWQRVIGIFTGKNARHASRMRAAALAKRQAQSALSQASNDLRSEENRLVLALQQHKKEVKMHVEKWTERAKAAEAKAVATARAREILRLLPGAAAIGPAGLQRLAVFLAAIENLVAGLARDPEIPADVRHRLPVPAGGQQSAGVLPSPNSLSTASTPPAEQKRKV
jgi:hypothetical protein